VERGAWSEEHGARRKMEKGKGEPEKGRGCEEKTGYRRMEKEDREMQMPILKHGFLIIGFPNKYQ